MQQLKFQHRSFNVYTLGMADRPARKPAARRQADTRTFVQLAFAFVMKTLTRAQQGITWTREDGKKIWVRNVAALVKAIQEYDGYHSKMLPDELRQAPAPKTRKQAAARKQKDDDTIRWPWPDNRTLLKRCLTRQHH